MKNREFVNEAERVSLEEYLDVLRRTDPGFDRNDERQGIATELLKRAHETAGGGKDIAVYLIADENAVPFYRKPGMQYSDHVMQYVTWTGPEGSFSKASANDESLAPHLTRVLHGNALAFFACYDSGNHALPGQRVWEAAVALEAVREYFSQYGMADRIREFDVSSATVELAAQALGCEPCRIAKTLSFMVDGYPVLVVTAGDAKIDNSRYKAQFGTKARMLTPGEAEGLVGHAVGGVCPFAINEGVSVYLDVSLKRFSSVFPACGSGNSAIELSTAELEEHSGFSSWIDVCKNWQS